ncbi:MAG TPA: YdcF family protein [Methylomirabilota bacterium]|nr:YdcF family protein [Methylomirabilota bacterium]
MGRRRRALTYALMGLALLAAGAVLAHQPLLRLIGAALVVEDSLQRADAIVVVAGGTPTREAAAAALFREGWASRVIVSNDYTPDRVRELVRLGIRAFDFQGESRRALERYGVPAAAIITLTEPVRITESELRAVHQAARAQGFTRLILVTSPHHTRRVRLVWSRESRGDVAALVVSPRGETFPDTWWRQRRMAEAVLHEYLGLLAVYCGLSGRMS